MSIISKIKKNKTILQGGGAQEFLIEKFNLIKGWILMTRFGLEYYKLSKLKKDQKEKFNLLKEKFVQHYEDLKKYDFSEYITEDFERVLKKLEKPFMPVPKFSFLANSSVRYVMAFTKGGKSLREELSFLESKYPEQELKDFLLEDYVGGPLIMNSKYLTSHNSIHHLHHLACYQEKTNCDFKQINTVVEWGGGYGNLAKIYNRFVDKKTTYIIFDVPLFSCVQWLYLSTIFGEDSINLFKNPNDTVQAGKINLIPVVFRDSHCNIKADLFISTWALSESGRDAQDYVVKDCNWYNSNHLLLAYSNSSKAIPDSERISEFAKKYGANIIDIDFLHGNHYLFL
ncbi:MAG: hypothetical protein COU40_01860 [Candidatus Moranbacteria bacterium CG10_big_fil_rev_8_21_14_0_10_35_21]|nr:MAG: hypothetical protein COU40_01860 [Candidatus Moranbacteria bacterium CG10_big_fil_rev_8_21_14_0_10_35_21]PJA88244.1 MAG: hypothetical protein CO139_04135 [Candidatus Moranbacteria bacterium CG_4_9_14_3_um_filter_36_9]